MHINFLFLDKTKESFLDKGISEYFKRLKRLNPAAKIIFKASKVNESNKAQVISAKTQDTEKLLKFSQTREKLVLFDLNGQNFSSEQWAFWLRQQLDNGVSKVNIGLGGHLGLDEKLTGKADLLLSLGSMTLTHEMARLLILEQTYRAFTIIKSIPYHK